MILTYRDILKHKTDKVELFLEKAIKEIKEEN
jgi:hypothetical protein